ncbi:hypothetical protein BKA70DRAFT_1532661 [Coprinopsis sp. MPI-PUGE-AT-0042]|nr:hypothetical protein BKA70DRAFT_1532661 [Coprinopsis sp. MPI-PUGE-AT-0042]
MIAGANRVNDTTWTRHPPSENPSLTASNDVLTPETLGRWQRHWHIAHPREWRMLATPNASDVDDLYRNPSSCNPSRRSGQATSRLIPTTSEKLRYQPEGTTHTLVTCTPTRSLAGESQAPIMQSHQHLETFPDPLFASTQYLGRTMRRELRLVLDSERTESHAGRFVKASRITRQQRVFYAQKVKEGEEYGNPVYKDSLATIVNRLHLALIITL